MKWSEVNCVICCCSTCLCLCVCVCVCVCVCTRVCWWCLREHTPQIGCLFMCEADSMFSPGWDQRIRGPRGPEPLTQKLKKCCAAAVTFFSIHILNCLPSEFEVGPQWHPNLSLSLIIFESRSEFVVDPWPRCCLQVVSHTTLSTRICVAVHIVRFTLETSRKFLGTNSFLFSQDLHPNAPLTRIRVLWESFVQGVFSSTRRDRSCTNALCAALTEQLTHKLERSSPCHARAVRGVLRAGLRWNSGSIPLFPSCHELSVEKLTQIKEPPGEVDSRWLLSVENTPQSWWFVLKFRRNGSCSVPQLLTNASKLKALLPSWLWFVKTGLISDDSGIGFPPRAGRYQWRIFRFWWHSSVVYTPWHTLPHCSFWYLVLLSYNIEFQSLMQADLWKQAWTTTWEEIKGFKSNTGTSPIPPQNLPCMCLLLACCFSALPTGSPCIETNWPVALDSLVLCVCQVHRQNNRKAIL